MRTTGALPGSTRHYIATEINATSLSAIRRINAISGTRIDSWTHFEAQISQRRR
jgi:hypothetical protein